MFDINKKKEELRSAFTTTADRINKIDEAVAKMTTERQAEVEKLLQIKGAFEQLEEIEPTEAPTKEATKKPAKKPVKKAKKKTQ